MWENGIKDSSWGSSFRCESRSSSVPTCTVVSFYFHSRSSHSLLLKGHKQRHHFPLDDDSEAISPYADDLEPGPPLQASVWGAISQTWDRHYSSEVGWVANEARGCTWKAPAVAFASIISYLLCSLQLTGEHHCRAAGVEC